MFRGHVTLVRISSQHLQTEETLSSRESNILQRLTTEKLELFTGKSLQPLFLDHDIKYIIISRIKHVALFFFLQSYPKYWPSEGSARYGVVTVQLLSQETSNNITTRRFTLENAAVRFVCTSILKFSVLQVVWSELLPIPMVAVCLYQYSKVPCVMGSFDETIINTNRKCLYIFNACDLC